MAWIPPLGKRSVMVRIALWREFMSISYILNISILVRFDISFEKTNKQTILCLKMFLLIALSIIRLIECFVAYLLVGRRLWLCFRSAATSALPSWDEADAVSSAALSRNWRTQCSRRLTIRLGRASSTSLLAQWRRGRHRISIG